MSIPPASMYVGSTEKRIQIPYVKRCFGRIWGRTVNAGQLLEHPVDAAHRSYIVVDGVERGPMEDVVFADPERIQIVCAPPTA